MFEASKKRLAKLPVIKWLHDAAHHDYAHLTQGDYFTHAMSTPLTSVTLHLERTLTLLEDKPQSKQEMACVSQALLHTRHLQTLLRLQTHHRIRASFPLKSAILEVVTRLSDTDRHLLSCHLLWNEELRVSGHSFYLQEALSCLISNSLQASSKHRQKQIAIIGLPLGRKVLFYICDAGQGMNWITHKLANLKGFTTKTQGMGQGLAFVKEVIEDYFKGSLRIKSETGIGTVVMLQLPLKA